jgi:hypothetical protein
MLCKICSKNETDNTSGICWQCVEFREVREVKENLKEKLKELIVRNTEYWLPYGKYDKKKGSCFIIEEKYPFFWRINPKWAEELAEKIIEFLKVSNNNPSPKK